MNEWMDEWINEWMYVCIFEGINEFANKRPCTWTCTTKVVAYSFTCPDEAIKNWNMSDSKFYFLFVQNEWINKSEKSQDRTLTYLDTKAHEFE